MIATIQGMKYSARKYSVRLYSDNSDEYLGSIYTNNVSISEQPFCYCIYGSNYSVFVANFEIEWEEK